MILRTFTNDSLRKEEFEADSIEGVALLSQIPGNLYSVEDITMVGNYIDSDYITIYFRPKSVVDGAPLTNEMFSMKYNTKDGSYYFKTYEFGNTTTNPVEGAQYTGRFSNNNNYTLYIHNEIKSLSGLLELKDGFISKTYDENHNELFESLYISNVSS